MDWITLHEYSRSRSETPRPLTMPVSAIVMLRPWQSEGLTPESVSEIWLMGMDPRSRGIICIEAYQDVLAIISSLKTSSSPPAQMP